MPTVFTIGSLRYYFYSNEGPRPHIHVGHKSRSKYPQMKVWLDTLEVARSVGFSSKAERDIMAAITKNRVIILEAWEDFFS